MDDLFILNPKNESKDVFMLAFVKSKINQGQKSTTKNN